MKDFSICMKRKLIHYFQLLALSILCMETLRMICKHRIEWKMVLSCHSLGFINLLHHYSFWFYYYRNIRATRQHMLLWEMVDLVIQLYSSCVMLCVAATSKWGMSYYTTLNYDNIYLYTLNVVVVNLCNLFSKTSSIIFFVLCSSIMT